MSNKPVVTYRGIVRIQPWAWNTDVIVAMIPVVLDHPRLGHCEGVRSSAVMYLHEDGSIETINTLYKPEEVFKDYYVFHGVTAQDVKAQQENLPCL